MTDLSFTADELTAVARRLGATRFPGVPTSLYEAVDGELHAVLDERFLATLTSRGLLRPDASGDLRPDRSLTDVLDAVVEHEVYVAVEQIRPGSDPVRTWSWSLLVGRRGLLEHWMDDPIHTLRLDPDPGDLSGRLGAALRELISAAPGDGRPAGPRRRGRRSGLDELMPGDGWRRATVLARTDHLGEAGYAEGFLAVFDGGPGDLWLVTPDDGDPGATFDDPVVVAEPATFVEVDAAIRSFATVDRVLIAEAR